MSTHTRIPVLFSLSLAALFLAAFPSHLRALITISTGTTINITTSGSAPDQYSIAAAGSLTINVAEGALYTVDHSTRVNTNSGFALTAAGSVLRIQGSGTTLFVSGTKTGANARGAAIAFTGGLAVLENISFGDAADLSRGNSAAGAGAVFLNSGTLLLTNGGFYGNTGNGGQNGGAMYIAGTVLVSMTNVIFEGNEHLVSGRNGGAIFANAGTTTLTNARFGVLGDASRGNRTTHGGAIFMNAGHLAVTDGEFYGNAALSGSGGAIYYASGVTGSLINVTFAENSAGAGGALVLLGTAGVPITSATFGIAGSATSGNTSGGDGGAIYHGAGQLTLTNVEFHGNRSGTAGSGRGGAIYNTGAATTGVLTNVVFKQNSSQGQGGAIFWSGGALSITNALFDANHTGANHAGAIMITNASPGGIIQSATFSGNSAAANAGAVYVWGNLATRNEVTVTDALFSSNTASNGGAMFVNGANAAVMLNDVLFTGNVASAAGGALTVSAGLVDLNVSRDTAYTENRAGTDGGFLHIDTGGTFNMNAAAGVTLTLGGGNAAEDSIGSGTHTDTVIGINSAAGSNGAVVLKSDNSAYRGRVNVNAGRLLLGGADAKLGGIIDVKSGAVFGGWGAVDVNDGVNRHVSIASGGTLQIGLDGASAGEQTLAFSGTLALANNTTINGDGALDASALGAGIVLGSAAGDTITADIAAGKSVAMLGVASGAGGIVKQGAGSLGLDGASTFTGGVLVTGGELRLGHDAALGTGMLTVSDSGTLVGFTADNLTIANNIVLSTHSILDTGANAVTLSGTISGPGGIVKTGAGRLELTTALAGTPSLAITGGTFAGAIDSVGAISIANASVYAGNLARGAGQSLAVSTGVITGTLSLTQGALLDFDLSEPVSSFLTLDALFATGTTTINLTNLGNGIYTIVTAGTVAVDLSNISYTVNGGGLTGRNSLAFTFSATDINVEASSRNLRVSWTAANGGAWDITMANWSDADSGNTGETRFGHGDSVRFGSAASGTITIASTGVRAGDIAVASAGQLVFSGGTLAVSATSASVDGVAGSVWVGGSSASATGKLVKTGAGTLTFANAAGIFEGGIDIESGVVSFNNAAQLDTTGTSIRFIGAGGLRADADILGATGTLTSAIEIVGVSATFNTQGNTVEYTGALASTGGASALAKTGTGKLVLRATDNSAFAAPVAVQAGGLLLADNAKLGGAITVMPGALAGGAGAFTGNVTIDNGSLKVGNGTGAPGVLNIGGALALTGSARVDFAIHAGGIVDTLNVTGAVSGVSASSIVGLTFASITSGSYALGNATALASAGKVEVNGILVDDSLRILSELSASAGTLWFVYGMDDARYMEWTGTGGASRWDIGLANWRGYNGDTGGKLKFQGGDTVRFATAADTAINIISGVVVSDMVVNNTGTLTFTGQGIITSLTTTGSLIANPEGKLVKQGTGALVFNNTANTFIGGIEINGGVLAFSNAAQIATAGAGINVTGSGTLQANASGITLSEAITLTNAVAVLDAGANAITLNGGLAGTGTLVKIGTGGLTYSGAVTGSSLLGANATTRIGAGYVLLRDFSSADAAALAHTFELNGGWLDLSDKAGFNASNDSTANDWAGLRISGTLGGVIGSNDRVTLRAGDAIGNIGDPALSAKQGVFVVVAAGGGVVTMTGSNSYAGYTAIQSGTLRISRDDQLGLASLNREVRITGSGGALEITADNFSSSRALTLAANGSIGVASSGTATWNGTITGSSKTLSKTGAGTLVLTATNNTASLGYHIEDGAIWTNLAVLKTSTVSTAAAGTLVLDQVASATYAPRITGEGAFEKRGAGALTITGTLGNTGATRILGGALKTGTSNLLNPASALAIGSGATLDIRGTRQSVASLASDGAILMTASVNSNAGAVIASDYLKASQSVIGSGTVNVSLAEVDSSQTTGPASVVLIESADNTAAFLFNVTGGAEDAIFGWDVVKDGGNYLLEQKRLVPVIPAVAGINGALLIGAETTFDSLTRQISTMRLNNSGGFRAGRDWWASATYRNDTIKEDLYNNATANTRGAQVGVNIAPKGRKSRIATGLFADVVETRISLRDAETATTTYSGGVYVSYQPDNAFYLDLILRASSASHKLRVVDVPELDVTASGIGAGVAIGYAIKTQSGWIAEPSAQIVWNNMGVDTTMDAAHRVFEISNVVSVRERLGLQITKLFQPARNVLIRPSFRAAYNHEFKGVNDVTVSRYHDANRTTLRDRYTCTDDFNGGSFIVGGGLAARFGEHLELWADASAGMGEKLKDHTISAGLGWRW